MADLSNMSPQAMAAWDALIQSWGRPLTPTSAYRDPSYNASVGGARGSQHIHGNAFDISTAGMSAEERAALIQAAKAAGFQGFGGYDDSLHFDVGAPRTWGSDYTGATTPDWLTAALGSQPSTQSSTFRSNKMPMTPQQPQGILGSLGIQKQDPNAAGETALPFYQRDRFKDTMGNLAMAFNELRMNPSQAIPQVVQNNRERRQTTAAGNRTIEWLRTQPDGEKYAQMAEALGPNAALQAYQQDRAAQAAAARGEVREVDGRLVRVMSDGTVQEIYSPYAGGGNPEDVAKLRTEFLGRDQVKAFIPIARQYRNIISSASMGTGPGDISLVFSYMKMLDPGSTVNSGEQASAANAGGVPSSVRGIYNQLVGGGSLDDTVRGQFVAAADQIYQNTRAPYDELASYYRELAATYGYDPMQIIPPAEYGATSPAGGTGATSPTSAPPPASAPPPTGVPMTASAIAAGVTQQEWDAMTTAERAEFR